MKQDEIKNLIINQGLTITDVIDAVIDLNGIIGVGLISLKQDLVNYVDNINHNMHRASNMQERFS